MALVANLTTLPIPGGLDHSHGSYGISGPQSGIWLPSGSLALVAQSNLHSRLMREPGFRSSDNHGIGGYANSAPILTPLVWVSKTPSQALDQLTLLQHATPTNQS